jgi:hypothetical protein
MRSFLPQVLYTVWCLLKSYAHKNNCKEKQLVKKIEKEKEKGKKKGNSTDRD